uniref:Uncharacterized protein n=1 Tax=Candidatus Kentrum sp. FM TaxID=2126340 RepID=A0A450SJK1_9GAMM|nr:MAG: hypothetical protein BECKFM1743A_GA0114220_101168 [Candidatus Kentron sp. FM]
MGLFIHLTINPKDIPPNDWEAAYQESLTLLRAFPVPLMRIAREEIRHTARYTYISDLVWDPGTPNEHWRVVGDAVSGRHAEDFLLFRHKEKQFKTIFGPPDIQGDILWVPPDDAPFYSTGNGIDIFGQKTQGYPYHLAVLAVAILLETRFPDQCYLSGDIEPMQVENMCRWVSKTLNTSVVTPICMDAKRLYRRVSTLYENPRHVMERFQALFGGCQAEKFEALLRYAGRPVVLKRFKQELGEYPSPDYYGAIRLIAKFLSATGDLEQLVEIALGIADQGKGFEEWKPAPFLRALCNHYLMAPYTERELLGAFGPPQDEPMTLDDALARAFPGAGGKPAEIDAHRSTHGNVQGEDSRVLAALCAVQPEKRALFREILSAAEDEAREQREETRKRMREMEQEWREKAQQAPAQDAWPADGLAPKAVSLEESYILSQVSEETEQFVDEEKSAARIGEQLRQMMEENPDFFQAEDRHHYLRGIYRATVQYGFALRAASWRAIDGEQELAILKGLFMLCAIKDREFNFWRWRIHLLESPSLWPYLLEAYQPDTRADDNDTWEGYRERISLPQMEKRNIDGRIFSLGEGKPGI